MRTVAGRLGHAGGGTTTLRSYTAWVSEADQRAATGLGTRMPVRPDPSVPVVPEREPAYLRAANELRRRIVDGELRVGGAPPSEKQVAAEFGVAVGTAHRVAASLADPASFRPHLVDPRMEAPERAGTGEGWIGDFERARNSRTQGEVAQRCCTPPSSACARWRRAPGRSLLSCIEPRSPSWASSPRSWACRPGRRARWLLRTTPVRRSRPAGPPDPPPTTSPAWPPALPAAGRRALIATRVDADEPIDCGRSLWTSTRARSARRSTAPSRSRRQPARCASPVPASTTTPPR